MNLSAIFSTTLSAPRRLPGVGKAVIPPPPEPSF